MGYRYNVLPPITTMTTTAMMAAKAPPDNAKAPFCEPAAPASVGSGGLSSPPLLPGGGSEDCASARKGSMRLKKRVRLMMARYEMLLRRGRRDVDWQAKVSGGTRVV
jgi:hypothetical protein